MRRFLLALLTVLLGASTAVGVPAPARAAAEDRTWRGLDVPYLSGGQVHFRGNAAREPLRDPDHPTSVVTLGATRSAAVVQAGGEGPLFELPAGRGPLRRFARAAVGVPMADPVGHWVFWTARSSGPRVRLMGYDTRRNLVRPGPLLVRSTRVWAVEGRTAYVASVGRGDTRRLASWTPGSPLRPLHPGLRQAFAEDRLLSAVDRGRYVAHAFDGEDPVVEVLDEEGALLASVPGGVADHFDPSGRYLSSYGDVLSDSGAGPTVWDSVTGASVPLQLGRWQPVALLWAPSGELVVHARDSRDDRDEESRARRFVCAPATGGCERLPDPVGVERYTVDHEPFDTSALAQLAFLLGS